MSAEWRRGLTDAGWRCEEPGWWVKDGVGGVCRERDGKWYAYKADDEAKAGPYRTLLEATLLLERIAGRLRAGEERSE